MQNIKVGRYSKEGFDGTPGVGVNWQGWIEPEDRSWIAFIDVYGRPTFFLNRDPVTGAILGDDPEERERDIKFKHSESPRGLYTGVKVTEEESKLPGVVTAPGEIVPPLGVNPHRDRGEGPTGS